jgi:hypothetical protein
MNDGDAPRRPGHHPKQRVGTGFPMATILAFVGAAVFALLGLVHLVFTLRDFGPRPRYFRPRNAALLPAMRQTRTNLVPGGRDYWSAILGFSLSHAIGLLLFALLIVLAGEHRIAWLQWLLVAVGIVYSVIAWRCWFRIPLLGALIGTVLMAGGWVLQAVLP